MAQRIISLFVGRFRDWFRYYRPDGHLSRSVLSRWQIILIYIMVTQTFLLSSLLIVWPSGWCGRAGFSCNATTNSGPFHIAPGSYCIAFLELLEFHMPSSRNSGRFFVTPEAPTSVGHQNRCTAPALKTESLYAAVRKQERRNHTPSAKYMSAIILGIFRKNSNSMPIIWRMSGSITS